MNSNISQRQVRIPVISKEHVNLNKVLYDMNQLYEQANKDLISEVETHYLEGDEFNYD